MNDYDRFAAFLREAAATYNEPPETPAKAMWGAIEQTLEARAAEDVEEGESGAAHPAAYHEPPEPPREAMWDRIESAWALQRSASANVGEERVVVGGGPRGERRAVAVWIPTLAVAASLVIGIALGRGTVRFGEAGTQLATGPSSSGVETEVPSPTADPSTRGAEVVEAGAARAPVVEPLETAAQLTATPESGAPDPYPAREAARPTDDATAPAERRDRVARYATVAHLGRAETLLTAFRSDPAVGQDELASWARELLGETRLLLDMSVQRAPRERGLLEELELLLAQIARLGPDAPAFERDLITEGLERRGTMAQLRSASVGT